MIGARREETDVSGLGAPGRCAIGDLDQLEGVWERGIQVFRSCGRHVVGVLSRAHAAHSSGEKTLTSELVGFGAGGLKTVVQTSL
jgi:hypothetical protein